MKDRKMREVPKKEHEFLDWDLIAELRRGPRGELVSCHGLH